MVMKLMKWNWFIKFEKINAVIKLVWFDGMREFKLNEWMVSQLKSSFIFHWLTEVELKFHSPRLVWFVGLFEIESVLAQWINFNQTTTTNQLIWLGELKRNENGLLAVGLINEIAV